MTDIVLNFTLPVAAGAKTPNLLLSYINVKGVLEFGPQKGSLLINALSKLYLMSLLSAF